MAIVAVFNQKGGVGKTTTALNLLASIAMRKQRPLAIDLDPQCHLTHIFGVHPRNADDSIFGFFMRQRPLDEVAQVTKSGVIMLPAHLELAKHLVIEESVKVVQIIAPCQDVNSKSGTLAKDGAEMVGGASHLVATGEAEIILAAAELAESW